jgi:quinol monooxygenase YgiN
MSVVVVVTAFPIPEHRAEVVAAFEEAITRVHDEPGVELYALHEGPDRLVTIEKYESEQARSEQLQGTALADLRLDLQGKLSRQSRRAGPCAPPGRERPEGRPVTARR